MTVPITRRLPQAAFDWADAQPLPAATETLPLASAAGRVLATGLVATTDMPARPVAATDGYALQAADTVGAGDYTPLPLQLRAGVPAAGEAAPVRAGEPLPAGTDAVLALAFAERRGTLLEVADTLAPGDGVVQAGEEWRAGEPLLPAGRCLRPQDLARLAQADIDAVTVWRRPRVRLLLAGRYTRDADGVMLAGLIERDGGEVVDTAAVADSAALVAALQRPGAELIVVAGATGDGGDDHAAASLASAGQLDIHRVAIHPGGNLALGRAGDAAVLLLPGTPLACFAAYDLLGARLLRRLARLPGPWPYRTAHLPLAAKLSSAIGQLDLCRVAVRDGAAHPLAVADGRRLATVVQADGFVLVPPESEGHPRGAEVVVYLYD